MHRPCDAQVLQSTNEVFISDGYGNHRVIVYDADTGAFKRMWGAFGKPPAGKTSCAIVGPKEWPAGDGPADFNVAHAIKVSKDGTVYLADRENRRVQRFDKDGKYMNQIYVRDQPFARNLALSADPEQQFLYTGHAKGIAIIDRKGAIRAQSAARGTVELQTEAYLRKYLGELLDEGSAKSATPAKSPAKKTADKKTSE